MKNEELKDEVRKEAMQAKIDAWAQEKRELNAMMERFGETERRISSRKWVILSSGVGEVKDIWGSCIIFEAA